MGDFLQRLREANTARDAVWDPEDRLPLAFRALEFVGEVGEVANNIKKLWREELGLLGSRVTLEDVKEEIGDALITLDLICMELGLDLAECATAKFNRTSEQPGFEVRL